MFENLIEGEKYIFHLHNGCVFKGKVKVIENSTCYASVENGMLVDFDESELEFVEPVVDLEKDVITTSNAFADTSVDVVLGVGKNSESEFCSNHFQSTVNSLKNKYCSIRMYSRDSIDGYITSVDDKCLYLSLLDGDKSDVEWKQINSLTLFSDCTKNKQLLTVDLYNFKIYVFREFYFDVFCNHVFDAHTKSNCSLNLEVDDEFVNIKLTGYDLLLGIFKSYVNQ